MSDRHKVAALSVVLAASVALFVLLPFGPASPGSGLPDAYLGRWYFGGTSGGISGTETATADGSWIVITPSSIERYASGGRHLGSEPLVVGRGHSIYTGSDAWLLDPDAPAPRVLDLPSEGVLRIADNVYDGFVSQYTRER